jgi:hypothetical protein
VNRQLSVSDRPLLQLFLVNQLTFSFRGSIAFFFHFRCAQTLFCVSFPPPSSLDRYFVTFCVSIARFQLRKFCRQRQTFLSYRLIFLFFTFVYRLRVFNSRCAFVFVIKRDTAISVKFLVLTRLFVDGADTSFVQAKQKVTVALSLVTVL